MHMTATVHRCILHREIEKRERLISYSTGDIMLGQAPVGTCKRLLQAILPRLAEARVTCSHLCTLYSRDQKSQ